jgi:hypothetical protein
MQQRPAVRSDAHVRACDRDTPRAFVASQLVLADDSMIWIGTPQDRGNERACDQVRCARRTYATRIEPVQTVRADARASHRVQPAPFGQWPTACEQAGALSCSEPPAG